MVDEGVQYEFKSVKTVRGTEARSIAKWKNDGWELVDQTTATLHTTLNFRRVKPKVPWIPIAAAAGAFAVLLALAGIVSAFQGEDDGKVTASETAATATAEPSEAPSPKPSPSRKPSPSPKPSPSAEENLTPENNAEFAALLKTTQSCDERLEPFAAKYKGRNVEFDASIQLLENHGSRKTRYDFLIAPGDEGANSTVGPNLKFEDINITDLHLTGENIPDSLKVGDLLRVVARIKEYNPVQCLFFLDPVSTRIR